MFSSSFQSAEEWNQNQGFSLLGEDSRAPPPRDAGATSLRNGRVNPMPNPHLPPISQVTGQYMDRQFLHGRKNSDRNCPVQNEYLQNYQLHQLQDANQNNQAREQMQISHQSINDRRPRAGLKLSDRNDEDVAIMNQYRQHPTDFITPSDTRRERFELNSSTRAPLGRVVGGPLVKKN